MESVLNDHIKGRTLRTVMMAKPLALERTEGGMTLSGPNACRGSTKLGIVSGNVARDVTRLEFGLLFFWEGS
jgi:hypothetical protein